MSILVHTGDLPVTVSETMCCAGMLQAQLMAQVHATVEQKTTLEGRLGDALEYIRCSAASESFNYRLTIAAGGIDVRRDV